MRATGLGLLLPEWAMVWCFVIAGAAFILGARRPALLLVAVPLFHWLVWPAVSQVFFDLPFLMQALITVLVPLLAVHGLISLVFGREAAGHFSGNWLVRLGDFLILTPARIIKIIWLRLFGH